ncbi:hypothetical protein IT570_06350 [Candidatus Sumerlaeota bacterium]|nr:hypothetical protein [Candidatus Sumerlaeota bacterium]
MTKLTRHTLTALLVAAPVLLFAQPTGGKLSGSRPGPAATTAAPATTPVPPKVGDGVKDAVREHATPAPAHNASAPVEKTARVIEYAKKDKTEVRRFFLFHKNAEGKLIVVEFDKLDGKEIPSNPESLDWALHTLGITSKGADGDPEVIGPDKKTYRVKQGWHSLNSSEVKKEASGPNGEKLLDTDLYVKGDTGWSKAGAKPKVKKTTSSDKAKPAAPTKAK